MRIIEFHPSVPAEVLEIIAYYEDISPRLGNEFRSELEQSLNHAREYPERHHFDPSGRRRGNLGKFPYHFLFRVFEKCIRVTVVRHNRRSQDYGERRK